MSSNFWAEELNELKNLARQYREAISALMSGHKEYTIDTGQSTRTVKKQDVSQLRSDLKNTYDLISQLEIKCGRSGRIARPLC